jgi:hypothetical protein
MSYYQNLNPPDKGMSGLAKALIAFFIVCLLAGATILILTLTGVIFKDKKIGTLIDGAVCPDDQTCKETYCKSGKRGFDKIGTGKKLVCCADVVLKGNEKYCNKQPKNNGCVNNDWCTSGKCRNTKGGTLDGLCDMGGIGDRCIAGDDCTNGKCGSIVKGTGTNITTTTECCPKTETVMRGNDTWCANLDDGQRCYTDEMCQSGSCRDNTNGTTVGTCGKADDDAKCERDVNCKNGHCGYDGLDDGVNEKVCCGLKGAVKLGDYYYCKGRAIGGACYIDEMCSSGKCDNSADRNKRGKCIS